MAEKHNAMFLWNPTQRHLRIPPVCVLTKGSTKQDHVEVRLAEHTHLHARCYLFYADQDSARIAPQTAITGTSDLTRAGLLTNVELNIVHRAHLTHEDIALK